MLRGQKDCPNANPWLPFGFQCRNDYGFKWNSPIISIITTTDQGFAQISNPLIKQILPPLNPVKKLNDHNNHFLLM